MAGKSLPSDDPTRTRCHIAVRPVQITADKFGQIHSVKVCACTFRVAGDQVGQALMKLAKTLPLKIDQA